MPSQSDDESNQASGIDLRAPAKVNLGLRIVGRRDDGYHLLESIFVPVDWSDALRIDWSPGDETRISLTVDIADDARGVSREVVTAGPDNLVHRAATAFLAAAGQTGTAAIALEKRLPAGAGMGGGSSDAGAVLRGLRDLFPNAVSHGDLSRIALGLGADVPFFLDPRPAWVGGIGEVIEPLARMPKLCLVLVNPGEALSTPAVFRAWDTLRSGSAPAARGAIAKSLDAWLEADSADRLVALLENDLEAAAIRLCPMVGRLMRSLEESGARAVSMSGSGATVFGIFDDASTAREAAVALDDDGRGRVWAKRVETGSAG